MPTFLSMRVFGVSALSYPISLLPLQRGLISFPKSLTTSSDLTASAYHNQSAILLSPITFVLELVVWACDICFFLGTLPAPIIHAIWGFFSKDHGDHVLLTESRMDNGGGLVMLGRSDGVL